MPASTRFPLSVLLLAAALLTAAPVRAQSQPSAPSYKNPGTARALAFLVPGGGQLYAGERGKGLALMLGSAASVAAGAALSNWEGDYDYTCSSNNCYDQDAYDPDFTPFFVGAGVAGALWLYGLLDAPGAARRANRRGVAVQVAPVPQVHGGELRPGFAVQFTF